MTKRTNNYYNKNAKEFFDNTAYLDMSHAYAKFHQYLPNQPNQPGHNRIMDAGAGSGRDTKHFMDNGFVVYSFDNSEELCKLASDTFDVTVHCHDFDNIMATKFFAGIWACASLVHFTTYDIRKALLRLANHTMIHGIIYVSFKYGTFQGVRPDGRYYTDMTEDKLRMIIRGAHLIVLEEWVTTDIRPGREGEKWLNAILTDQGVF